MATNTNTKTSADQVEELDHHESTLKPSEIAQDAAAKGQATTGYEKLTILQSVKTFRRTIVFCTLAAFSAAADGYQIGYIAHKPVSRPRLTSSQHQREHRRQQGLRQAIRY